MIGFKNICLAIFNPNFSTLVEGINCFWRQHRILREKLNILPTGHVWGSKFNQQMKKVRVQTNYVLTSSWGYIAT